jgi:phosphoglycolate phosphatase
MSAQDKFIVWDWNGTLLDDAKAVLDCYNLILARLGRAGMSIESFREWHDMPFEIIYRRAGLNDEDIGRLKAMAEHNIFHDHYEPLADRLALREGVTEILGRAATGNVHSYILSNHIVDPIRRQLDRLGIERHFREVLAYESRALQFKDMTKGERLRRYIKAQALHPGNAVIIGDTLEEIDIARDLGLISVALTGGVVSEVRLRAAKPDYLIHSLHELAPILQERRFVA